MKDYFAKLTRLIRTHGLKAHQIFNMDEKGFLMGVASRGKVLCRRGRWKPHVTHDGGRELVTVVEGACAAGNALSPLVINKGQGHYLGWFQNLTDKEKKYRFSFSPKGWIDNRLAMLWLKEVFQAETAQSVGALPRLLILDGHGSHFTWEFAHYCDKHNILLLCLPSHSTHLLQPLNVGLFSPYQHFYGQAVDDYMRSGHNVGGVKKSLFIPFLTIARERTFQTQSIQQAFAATGIWPLCARRVLGKMAPETTSRRDTMGVIASPRTSRDIRRRIITAEKVLDEGFGLLKLSDPPPVPSISSGAAEAKRLVARVKTIMRDLGHQLEEEIAHSELYREQTRKLQGLSHLENKTDRRLLSTARVLTGAALIELRDQRLAKDAKAAEKREQATQKQATIHRKGPKRKIRHRTPRQKRITIANTPMVILVDSEEDSSVGAVSDSAWDGVPVLGGGDDNLELAIQRIEAGKSSSTRESPGFSARHLAPDRPPCLHMVLRSRQPATKTVPGKLQSSSASRFIDQLTNESQTSPRRGKNICYVFLGGSSLLVSHFLSTPSFFW